MIRIEHISKSFNSHVALDDVSLHVKRGHIFGLLGPNGAGKTTLLRIVNRILTPDSGSVLFAGHPLCADDAEHIGYLPEERGLYKKMKVAEQALYLAQLKGVPRREAEARLHTWLDRFELSAWANRRVGELSKGMQQKLQFIVTVLHRPELLIFDEPFSGFDPVNAALLKECILQLRDEGATVILSTHNMSSVEELCNEIALLDTSHVVLAGEVDHIRQAHRTNRYKVVYRTETADKAPQLPAYAKTLSVASHGGNTEMLLELSGDGQDANDLIAKLMPQCRIVAFNEVLPTMNDIFIERVKY